MVNLTSYVCLSRSCIYKFLPFFGKLLGLIFDSCFCHKGLYLVIAIWESLSYVGSSYLWSQGRRVDAFCMGWNWCSTVEYSYKVSVASLVMKVMYYVYINNPNDIWVACFAHLGHLLCHLGHLLCHLGPRLSIWGLFNPPELSYCICFQNERIR